MASSKTKKVSSRTLGTGMASKAGGLLGNRGRQIDAAVNAATGTKPKTKTKSRK